MRKTVSGCFDERDHIGIYPGIAMYEAFQKEGVESEKPPEAGYEDV